MTGGPIVHVEKVMGGWQVVARFPPSAVRERVAAEADVLRGLSWPPVTLTVAAESHLRGIKAGRALAETCVGDPEELLRAVLQQVASRERSLQYRVAVAFGAREWLAEHREGA